MNTGTSQPLYTYTVTRKCLCNDDLRIPRYVVLSSHQCSRSHCPKHNDEAMTFIERHLDLRTGSLTPTSTEFELRDGYPATYQELRTPLSVQSRTLERRLDDMLTSKRALNAYFLGFTSISITRSHVSRLICRFSQDFPIAMRMVSCNSHSTCVQLRKLRSHSCHSGSIERKASREASRDSDRAPSNNKSPLYLSGSSDLPQTVIVFPKPKAKLVVPQPEVLLLTIPDFRHFIRSLDSLHPPEVLQYTYLAPIGPSER